MALEQIHVAGENEEKEEKKDLSQKEKVVDSAEYSSEENVAELDNPQMDEEEADRSSTEVVTNPESKDQINQLVELWNKYRNWELRDLQKEQYENLMTAIRTELDKNVPTIIDMNREIDVNYYNEHPEEAAKMADEIVQNYNNMWDVELVNNVVSRRDYLSEESKGKIDKVLNEVLSNLDDATKNLLEKN